MAAASLWPVCQRCAGPLPQRTGPGKPRKWCAACKPLQKRQDAKASASRRLEHRRQHDAKRREHRKANHLCRRCGKPNMSARLCYCDPCNEKNLAWQSQHDMQFRREYAYRHMGQYSDRRQHRQASAALGWALLQHRMR